MNLNKLKLNGIKYYIGSSVKLNIKNGNVVVLKDKVYFSDNCRINCSGGNISIGFNTFFNHNCNLVSLCEINIGDNCLFGPNVNIFDHNHKYENSYLPICKQGYITERVKIGSDVWIGANCVILPGVNIEDHVIVGANSVVTKNLKGNAMYAGSPAKFIKNIY